MVNSRDSTLSVDQSHAIYEGAALSEIAAKLQTRLPAIKSAGVKHTVGVCGSVFSEGRTMTSASAGHTSNHSINIA